MGLSDNVIEPVGADNGPPINVEMFYYLFSDTSVLSTKLLTSQTVNQMPRLSFAVVGSAVAVYVRSSNFFVAPDEYSGIFVPLIFSLSRENISSRC